jgi:hypothetical protein
MLVCAYFNIRASAFIIETIGQAETLAMTLKSRISVTKSRLVSAPANSLLSSRNLRKAETWVALFGDVWPLPRISAFD